MRRKIKAYSLIFAVVAVGAAALGIMTLSRWFSKRVG